MSMPVSCGLDACCKVLRCPGLSALPMRGWVSLGCAHGPDSWQKPPQLARLKSQLLLRVGSACEGPEF